MLDMRQPPRQHRHGGIAGHVRQSFAGGRKSVRRRRCTGRQQRQHFGARGIHGFGGALIVIGLLTRPVAFVLSGFMAAAYFMAHIQYSFFPAINGGEAAVLSSFVFLYIAAAGPGPLSVDRG